MASKKTGNQTFVLCNPPSIAGHANVVGQKEGAGPLKNSFDLIGTDDAFGERSWEKAEVEMQKRALSMALEKAKQTPSVLDFLFAGDLLNQCISAGYAARGTGIPFFGLYGACSTMAESLGLAALLLDGEFGEWGAAVTSSHFCSAERQYLSLIHILKKCINFSFLSQTQMFPTDIHSKIISLSSIALHFFENSSPF